MGLFQKKTFTPEDLGAWLVEEQERFCVAITNHVDGLTSIYGNPSLEARLDISVHGYCLLVAIVAMSWNLDDSRYVSRDNKGPWPIDPFLQRLQHACYQKAVPFARIRNGRFEHNPITYGPCIMPLDTLISTVLRHYVTFFLDINDLESVHGEIGSVTRPLVISMNTDNPLAIAATAAFFHGFARTSREIVPDSALPTYRDVLRQFGCTTPEQLSSDVVKTSVFLEIHHHWCVFFAGSQRRMISHVDQRRPKFN